MSTLTVILAIIGAVSLVLLAIMLTGSAIIVAVNRRSRAEAAESEPTTVDEDDEDEVYTLETLMESNSGPAYMAVSLHELFRTFRAAGFTHEEAYGLVQNALYASIVAQAE